jgi:hypothetical protein
MIQDNQQTNQEFTARIISNAGLLRMLHSHVLRSLRNYIQDRQNRLTEDYPKVYEVYTQALELQSGLLQFSALARQMDEQQADAEKMSDLSEAYLGISAACAGFIVNVEALIPISGFRPDAQSLHTMYTLLGQDGQTKTE